MGQDEGDGMKEMGWKPGLIEWITVVWCYPIQSDAVFDNL